MPIHCALKLQPISNAEFTAIDRVVMGCAFASQNRLGRLCDERVYENDVAARLRAEGFRDVITQEPIFVTWQEFTKRYRLDLVVNQMVYEFKTVSILVGEHDAQAIHYGTLLNIDRVKLLNFRSHEVVGRLKRCPIMGPARFQVTADRSAWRPLSDRCEWLANLANDLFREWGGFLDTQLYEDALKHFCGGEEFCQRRVCIMRDGIELGTHPLSFHADSTPFVITSFTDELAVHEDHLQRLLCHTGLSGLQWLNFNRCVLQMKTVVVN